MITNEAAIKFLMVLLLLYINIIIFKRYLTYCKNRLIFFSLIGAIMNKNFIYNEYKQAGTDYSDTLNVESYDKYMRKSRDYKKEAEYKFYKEYLCVK